MNAFFSALNELFSNPFVASVTSALEVGTYISSAVKLINKKISDDSIESKILSALDIALQETCKKIGWEYDSLVVSALKDEIDFSVIDENALSKLFKLYSGASFTPEATTIWIDEFDQAVAKDQILNNYFSTKLLRTLIDGVSTDVTKEILSEDDKVDDKAGLQKILDFSSSNELVFNSLRESILLSKNVIPFVGAGISAFVYPTWKSILTTLAYSLSTSKKETALTQIMDNQYLDAAQTICNALGKTTFYNALRRCYAEEKINNEELKRNAAYYIPRINDGNCITTNYDRVLEHAYFLNSIPYDVADYRNTYKLSTYYRTNNKKGLLFKIHGDILSNTDNILLSRDSYEKNYQAESELTKQLKKWLSGKIFLFIGSSLFNDQPIQILKEVVEEGIENYAIYSCKASDIDILKEQFDELGIMPMFYDESDHSALTVILRYLLQ